jgi:5-methylcytosine-specific restriction endonuclease McrA
VRPDDQRSAQAIGYRSWYWSAEWKQRRRDQLAREPNCRRCAGLGKVVPATIANHVIPHRGNPKLFWHGELESVCKPHHDATIQAEERRGFKVGNDARGRPIDPNHPWNRRP